MKPKSVKKGRPRRTEKKARGKPRRAAKKARHPLVAVKPRDGWRKGEALTISDTREEALALAERIKIRFAELLKESK